MYTMAPSDFDEPPPKYEFEDEEHLIESNRNTSLPHTNVITTKPSIAKFQWKEEEPEDQDETFNRMTSTISELLKEANTAMGISEEIEPEEVEDDPYERMSSAISSLLAEANAAVKSSHTSSYQLEFPILEPVPFRRVRSNSAPPPPCSLPHIILRRKRAFSESCGFASSWCNNQQTKKLETTDNSFGEEHEPPVNVSMFTSAADTVLLLLELQFSVGFLVVTTAFSAVSVALTSAIAFFISLRSENRLKKCSRVGDGKASQIRDAAWKRAECVVKQRGNITGNFRKGDEQWAAMACFQQKRRTEFHSKYAENRTRTRVIDRVQL